MMPQCKGSFEKEWNRKQKIISHLRKEDGYYAANELVLSEHPCHFELGCTQEFLLLCLQRACRATLELLKKVSAMITCTA